jgi:hypothetical protein
LPASWTRLRAAAALPKALFHASIEVELEPELGLHSARYALFKQLFESRKFFAQKSGVRFAPKLPCCNVDNQTLESLSLREQEMIVQDVE